METSGVTWAAYDPELSSTQLRYLAIHALHTPWTRVAKLGQVTHSLPAYRVQYFIEDYEWIHSSCHYLPIFGSRRCLSACSLKLNPLCEWSWFTLVPQWRSTIHLPSNHSFGRASCHTLHRSVFHDHQLHSFYMLHVVNDEHKGEVTLPSLTSGTLTYINFFLPLTSSLLFYSSIKLLSSKMINIFFMTSST